jgi:hypothetical protein
MLHWLQFYVAVFCQHKLAAEFNFGFNSSNAENGTDLLEILGKLYRNGIM